MRFTTQRPRLHQTIHWFTVTGSGDFPIDMLRYDMAWPATSDEAEKIFGVEGHRSLRKRSIRMGCAMHEGPTIGRWSSFGWTVGDADRGEVG